ncbi:MAG: hypothetical protein H8D84_01680 [Proteobacteria bacterium]|nr:hypothetical protein [Pseudomonadota bacterium]
MFLYALKKKYEAEIAEHTSVVDTYLKNPVGVPDHDNILETIKKRYDKLTISNLALKNINELLDKAQEDSKKNKK